MPEPEGARAGTISRLDVRPLPEGWRWVKLDQVCQSYTGIRDPRLEPDKPFWYVDISSVDNATKRITEAKVVLGKNAPSRARQVIKNGDVLVSTTRPNLNAVALVPSHLDDQICSTGFCVLRPSDDLDRNYLFSFVQTAEFVESLSSLVKGALYPAVTDKQVRSQIIPLPPLPEQRRIAAILQDQLAAVDRARAAAEEQLEAAQALPAAYLRAVFNSPEAQQWPRKPLSEVSEIAGGLQKTPDRAPVKFHKQYLTVRNVQRGYLDLSQVERFEVSPEEFARLRLLTGDILIVEGNGSLDHIGRNALFVDNGEEWIHQNHIIRVRLKGDVCSPEFASRFLNSDQGKSQMIEKAKTTSGLYTLSAGKVASLEVPLPSLSDQTRITALLSEQMAAAEQTRIALQAQLDAINRLPAALLRRAFNGEL